MRLLEFTSVSQSDLDQVERYADKLFAKVGLDVEFTKHFLQRVNDTRNQKPITSAELVRLFRQEYQKHGLTIGELPAEAEAVMKDMETDINVPFKIVLNKDGDLDLIAKTIMRKPDFKTSNQTFNV
jgi:hypothetical protein|tara:strand:+ start:317 stop:694 length:378 start_codon:yes stop_codon:yes gene_type:complete